MMKKVNKKLASAVVLALMMAVPFSASANTYQFDSEGNQITDIDLSGYTESDVIEFVNTGKHPDGYYQGCIIIAKDNGGSGLDNKELTTDASINLNGEWANNAFYVRDGATLTIGASNIKTVHDYSTWTQVFHAWNGTMNVNVANDIDIQNVYTGVYSQRVDSDTVTGDSTVNISAGGNINFEANAGIVASNFNDAGNDQHGASVNVAGKNVTVKGTDGYAILSRSAYYGSDGLEYKSEYAGKTSVTVKADENLHVEGTSGAIFAKNGKNENDAKVVLEAKNITVNGDIIADTNAYVGIGKNEGFEKATITGDITATNNSTVDIDLGNGGIFTGSVNKPAEEVKFVAANADASKVSINMGSGSVWNVTGTSTVSELTGDKGTIKIDNTDVEKVTVDANEVKDLTLASGSSVTDSFNGNDLAGSLQDFAGKLEIAGEAFTGNIKAEAGSVIGETTAVIDKDGNVTSVVEKANEFNAGISEMASIGLMAWRAENNDMNKRLGELRNSNGEHGVWARMMRGESEFGSQSIKNTYNTYQLGYDEKLSTDEHWTVGAAISYTDAQSSFTTGSGENRSTGFAMYGSYLGNNGTFVDLIAKYARLDNEFDVYGGAGSGDYSTNGYSVSAEYGKRTQLANDFYFEPQVELTYGKVADVDYMTSNGVKVSQDAMDSLVGRVGFAVGKNIKNGNVYVRASYLYDFDGETSVTFTNNTSRTFEEDLGGGWFEFGIGTNINLSDATYLYFDVEKTTGGEVDTNWQWNAGVRYSF